MDDRDSHRGTPGVTVLVEWALRLPPCSGPSAGPCHSAPGERPDPREGDDEGGVEVRPQP
jgi:hypothetical protein